jgi:hypothetical protein
MFFHPIHGSSRSRRCRLLLPLLPPRRRFFAAQTLQPLSMLLKKLGGKNTAESFQNSSTLKQCVLLLLYCIPIPCCHCCQRRRLPAATAAGSNGTLA